MTAEEFTTLEQQMIAEGHYQSARRAYRAGHLTWAAQHQRSGAWWSHLARGDMDAWIVANHPEWCQTP